MVRLAVFVPPPGQGGKSPGNSFNREWRDSPTSAAKYFMTASDPIVLYRWVAKITYRRDAGNEERLVSFEELHELHDIVEEGPDFYAIENIEIRSNGRVPLTTIEQAARS